MKNFIRKQLEKLGINLSRSAMTLGLTPLSDIYTILNRLRPQNNGWELIRIGATGDGGYLIPDDLQGVRNCFSPGSDLLWDFENTLAKRYGIKSFICDSTDKRPPNLSELQDFTEGWIGPATVVGQAISVGDWILSKNLTDSDMILQMDIEGAEFLSVLALSETDLLNFRIIVMELHFLEGLKNRWAFSLVYQPFFDKLLAHFDVVHLHPNNCCGTWKYANVEFPRIIEVTLHRKDRVKVTLSESKIPHVLDSDCVPSNKPLSIDWELISPKGIRR